MNTLEAYLGYFPTRFFKELKGSSLVCLQLIFKLSKEQRKYIDIPVPQDRQREFGLDQQCFLRGINKLERLNIIIVKRSIGNPFNVSITEVGLTEQDKRSIAKPFSFEKGYRKRVWV